MNDSTREFLFLPMVVGFMTGSFVAIGFYVIEIVVAVARWICSF